MHDQKHAKNYLTHVSMVRDVLEQSSISTSSARMGPIPDHASAACVPIYLNHEENHYGDLHLVIIAVSTRGHIDLPGAYHIRSDIQSKKCKVLMCEHISPNAWVKNLQSHFLYRTSSVHNAVHWTNLRCGSWLRHVSVASLGACTSLDRHLGKIGLLNDG